MAKIDDKYERNMQFLESMKEFNMEAFLKRDVDLSKFYSKQELEKMCEAEQRRRKNIALNYELMVMMKLPAIKPEFMLGTAHRARQAKARERSPSLKHNSDTDSDEEWTPDMERKRKAKEQKRFPCFYPKSRAKETRTKSNTDTPKAKKPRKSPTKPTERNYNLRERNTTTYMYLEPPDDDHFIYCEECNKEYDMDCPVHGPLNYIQDTEFSKDSSLCRAMQSLPLGMTVKTSSIPGAGLGVFTTVDIPSRTMFGPYGGVRTIDAEKAHSSGYCWQVYKDGKSSHFVDAQDETNSNWMRFVNCANSEMDQNLVAFQFKGGIYYRSYKCIPAGVELLVWYGDEYARELGVIRDKNLLLRPKLVNGEECFPCVFCKTVFSTAAYCVKHLIRLHGKDKLTQTDIQVLDEWLRKNTSYKNRKSTKDNSRLECNEKANYENKFMKSSTKYDLQNSAAGRPPKSMSETANKPYNSDLVKHSRTHTGDKPYKCDVCGYATSDNSHLVRHMRTHTGDKPYKCDVCGYATSRNDVLVTHMRTHTGDKPYKCDVCGYAASHNGSLVRHMRTHTGDKPYKCDVCGYATSQNGALVEHMRTHTGDKPYKCDVCGYAASQNGDLVKHMRTHTGDKPYKCDVCGYAASHNGSLVRHMRSHTGDKPYKCDVCGYAASQNGVLVTHMRTHTGDKPYKCDVCGYAASDNSTLVKHMRTHTGDKPYKCDVCGYATSVSNNLVEHMRTHTGDKPYKCDVCGYAASHNGSLVKHMRTHTGDKPYKCDV